MIRLFVVEGGGFEPPKSLTTDLQSVPFGRSGTLPYKKFGAGDWNRTRNLLITNQLLCQLSYTSKERWCLGAESNHRHGDFQSPALPTELPRHIFLINACNSKHLSIWRPGRGSNPRPPAWQAGVLTICTTGPNNNFKEIWWAFTDSNRGPIGYEPTALTNWAKGPRCALKKKFIALVGVKRLELPTPWSQTTCATNCATPRFFKTL